MFGGEGEDHNNENYSGIDRPGLWGGFICNGHNRVKGHVWGGGGDHNNEYYSGLTGHVVGWGGSYVMDTTE